MLGTCSLCKGGVMILWLGHWDVVWVPTIMTCLFVLWLRSELSTFHYVTLKFAHYNVVAVFLMHSNRFPACLSVLLRLVDPVGMLRAHISVSRERITTVSAVGRKRHRISEKPAILVSIEAVPRKIAY